MRSNSPSHASSSKVSSQEVRLDRLLGRSVLGRNNRPAGRLEEFRAEIRGGECVITEFVLGTSGLLERLGVGVKLLFGRAPGGYVARWDQLDLTDPERPRLACSFEELRTL
jgi:hypothetical protein